VHAAAYCHTRDATQRCQFGEYRKHQHLRQECHNSKFVIFQEKSLKVLKCCNFLWVWRRHNCSPAASFANCVMTLYLLKLHLQTFLSIPMTQKYQILSCDTLVANERYFIVSLCYSCLCVVYVFLDAATLTEVFPCFFLSCKANVRANLAKTGHGPHSHKLLCSSMYCLFCFVLCTVCV